MTEKKRGLGRGLGALIPSGAERAGGERPVDVFFPGAPTQVAEPAEGHGAAQDPTPPDVAAGEPARHDLLPVPGATFAELPVGQIVPNPRQPRSVFDEDALAELVHSVREIGVLQPVVVRRVEAPAGSDGEDGPRYELVMGERRWRATQEAGLATIPAIVRDTADDDLLRDALLENLHRSQLNPLEEAAAYAQLLEDFGCTHDELATRIGRSRPADLEHHPPAQPAAAGAAPGGRRGAVGRARPRAARPGRRRGDGAARPADRGRGALGARHRGGGGPRR